MGDTLAVLITGGTGFVGSYVARTLIRRGESVVTFDNLPSNVIDEVLSPEERTEVKTYRGDVTNLGDLAHVIQEHKIDSIVHLASMLHPACNEYPDKAVDVNIKGQVQVLEAARLFNLRKIVWASSIVVFGQGARYIQPVPNDAPHYPVSVYGSTKSSAEFITDHYIKTWSIDALGLRLTLVYGPGRVRGATAFVNELLMKPPVGQPAHVLFGDDAVDWQYVEDVASLFDRCLQAERTKTTVFNTCFDVRSIREVGAYVKSLIPDAQINFMPGAFGLPWKLDDSLLQQEIGFTPEFPMERGALAVINFARQNAGLPLIKPSA